MFRIARVSLTVFTLSLLSLAFTGCESLSFYSSSNGEAAEQAPMQSYERLSPTAPPAPKVEFAPIDGDPRKNIWRPGYWSYNGSGFDWVPGTFIARPSATAVWSPDQWLQHDYGWAFVAGYWQ